MKVKLCLEHPARLLMAAVITLGLTASATAQTLLIDFGSDSSFRGVSVPAPDVNGNFWNSLTPGPYFPDLIDITGAVSTIDLGFATPVGTDSFNGPAGVTTFPDPTPAEIAATDIDAAALGNLGVQHAAIDFAAADNGPSRFEIQGLDPLKTYTLTLFGSHKFSTDDATVYTIFSDNTYMTPVATASLNVQTPGSPNLHNRDKVATISNVAPQASNILYVQFAGANGGAGYLNSFQITATAVPEPGTLLLGACGVGLAACFRRRR
jgi:hypothetical protein